jgi:hypothetical protein
MRYISKGNILAFHNFNDSVQTSLYDLFNKSYTKINGNDFCRIAFGLNSNSKCFVH